jgi:hypothetical protein
VSKKQKIFLAILGALTVLVAVVLLISNTFAASTHDDTLSQQTTQAARSFTVDDARFLESTLSSSEKDEQAKALVPGLRDAEWSSGAVLPSGAKLTIQQATFVVDQDGYAQVDAVISGTVSATFVVGLVLVDGQWLIYATEQKG